MDQAHLILLVGGALTLLAVLAGILAQRHGTPVLLVFLVLGMLAGEDGPGGINFDDVETTYLLGAIALAIILFEGGLKTSPRMLRLAIAPALALATVGVAVTAAIVGAAAVWLTGISWPAGLLLGALVAPTDAAAVAGLLRASTVRLPERVNAVLEVESGLNDPMAVFLTVVLVEAVHLPAAFAIAPAALLFAWEMAGGVLLGLAGGAALVWLARRLRADHTTLPVLALAIAITIFAGAQALHASGFLAVYIAGVIAGARIVHAQALETAFEAFAWLAQIGLFLMLGLLVTPHELLPLAGTGTVLALVLILVARPLATLLCLKPLGYGWGETGFIAWVGLRGAVPIFLALVPMLEGLKLARLGFAVAFVIVLVSLIVQGWTIGPAARITRLIPARAKGAPP